MRWRTAAVLSLALLAGRAEAAEVYRSITLTDGRNLVGEVLETEATGMRVRTPQGEITVPFARLGDMVETDAAAFRSQPPVRVFLAADATYRPGFVAAYEALSAVEVFGVADLQGDQQRAATACDTDLACLADTLAGLDPWAWIVVGRIDGSLAVFEGAVSGSDTRTRTTAPRIEFEAVNEAAWGAIEVRPWVPEPIAEVPPDDTRRPPRERRPLTRERLVGLSFVPLPGYPSLAAGDMTGFGIGLATVVPATALWVGATGKATQSPAGHVALSLGGYYAATVVVNNVLGVRTLERQGTVAVGVAPTQQGGAGVSLTVVK